MSDPSNGGLQIRRIIVAVSNSPDARAAISMAARLAAHFHATLQGLFVEDIDLVNLAALPVGRVVHFSTGRTGAFDSHAMEEHFRSERTLTKHTLQTIASELGIESSFQVRRGRVDSEILAAAEGADLLVLGVTDQPHPRKRPGSVALSVVARGSRPVMLLRPGDLKEGGVTALLNNEESSEKVLEAAILFANKIRRALNILIASTDTGEIRRLRDLTANVLQQNNLKADISELPGVDVDSLCHRLRRAGVEVLTMSADDNLLQGNNRQKLFRRVMQPLLLVR